MTLPVSPALVQVETALKVSTSSFAKNNYRSVFDVARTSRKQFIADNMTWLGLRGGKAWDLAVGQAQYIRRLFREKQLTRQIRLGLPQTLSGQQVVNSTSSDNIQGLVQDGPTWRNQFAENWQAYCQSGAPEAVDSPVSYLTWLYKQALTFEEEIQASSTADQVITLAERRPDLATLTIDNDAINQQIPALQLVNEILEESIATVLPADQSVDKTLAETRYPTLLPYHFPHDQAELALLNAGVPLEEIIGETAIDWPWFLNDSWRGERSSNSTALASGLAPEQQSLMTEADNSTASDLTVFYKANLGLEASDYTVFEDIDTFTRQLGITVPQVEELIAGNIGDTAVTLSPNVVTPDASPDINSAVYSASFINEFAAPPLQIQKGEQPVLEEQITGEVSVIGEGSAGYFPILSQGVAGNGIKVYGTQKNYIKLGENASQTLSGNTDFTIGFWFYSNSSPSSRRPIACNCTKFDYGKVGFGISMQANNTLYVTAQNSITYCAITSADAVPLNTWCYIACGWDAETQTLMLAISHNGAQLATKTASISNTSGTMTGSTSWVFNESGSCNYYTTDISNPFSYIVDDICVWKDLLTVPQVEALVAGNAGGSSVVISENVDANIYIPSPDYYGAAFINNERTSMINGSFVMPQGGEKVSGHFDNGIMLDSRNGQGAYLNYDVFSDMTKDATLGFWYKVPSDIPVNAIVVGNTEGTSLNNKGVSLSIGIYNQRVLQLFASDGTNTINNNSYYNYINTSEWNYVALTYSAADKKLTLYQSTYDSEFDVSGFETLSSGANTFWFNGNTDNDYYQAHPDYEGQVSYDDITVWDRCLTLDDITTIVNSAVPVSQIAALSDYTDNLGFAPAISMVAPESSELMLSNSTYVNGKFGQGIQTRSADDSYFYFKPDGKVAQAMKGDKSFTLGFWAFRDTTTKQDTPIFSNAGDADSVSYSSGFSLTSSGPSNTVVYALLEDKKGANHTNPWWNYFTIGKWYYLALCWDALSQQANWYMYQSGSTISEPLFTFDASDLGDITTADGFTWAFNTRGDLSRTYHSSDDTNTFLYDDIAVFNGVLTAEDINTLVTSGKPIAETDLSGFPATCIWTSSLDHGLQNLSDARMDRINRMVRLQRWLGLSYEETDLLLSACIRAQGVDNKDFTLNTHTLRALGVFRHWQQKYGVTAFQFAAVLDEITPYAISPAVPFFDQVFNSPSLFDEPFAITGQSVSYTDVTGDSARTVRQMCAGLGITQAQFRVLADKVAAEQGDAEAQTFPLTLAVVSAFYRLVMVPRWLGLSFADGAALLSLAGEGDAAWTTLAGVPQLAALTDGQPAGGDILDLLMALDAAAAWAADHKLSWVKSWLALQPETDALVATSATVNFVNGIKQQLPAALIRDYGMNGLPLSKSGFLNIVNGSTPVSSVLGAAHGTQLDTELGQYAIFSSAANALADGDTSYSIGMWVKITSDQTESFPVLTNAAAYDHSNSPGIAIYNGGISPHGKGEYQLFFSVVSDETDRALSRDNTGLNFECGKWFWLGLATDVVQKSATVYAWSEDGNFKSSATLTWEGPLIMASGNVWALAQNGALDGVLGKHSVFAYDDVTLWDSILTEDDIAAIVASGKPATKTVPATFTNSDIFADLVDDNGLVLPAASNYEVITQKVSADLDNTGITFASEADREQAISSLSGIINQARLAQKGIADSALAQMFGTAQSLPPYLLSWAGDSEYRLLSDSLAMNSGAALTDPSQVPATYLTDLFALGQRAGIATAFTLTPATLSAFLAHPEWFGVSDTALSLTLLYRFSRYGDWLAVAGNEDRVLAYLSRVNSDTPPDATQAADTLALLLAWESSEVADATAALPGGLAKTVTDVDYVMRLQQLSTETGLSVTPLLATGELVPGGVTDTWDAWQSAGESLVAAQSGQQ